MDINFFMKNMEINSLVSALCIKHMIEFISKNKKTVIASLTARLGSIFQIIILGVGYLIEHLKQLNT